MKIKQLYHSLKCRRAHYHLDKAQHHLDKAQRYLPFTIDWFTGPECPNCESQMFESDFSVYGKNFEGYICEQCGKRWCEL